MRTRGQGISGPRTTRLRKFALVGMLAVTAIVMSGCTWKDAIGLGWPKGATDQAKPNYELWIWSVVAAFVIGAIVLFLLFWTTTFHRHKKGETELPRQFGYNMPLELVLTIIPFVIISVLFYFTVKVQDEMTHLADDPDVVVDVTAFQWNWKFGYQKVDFDGLNYDGVDETRQGKLTSVPEGVDAHGHEKVGAIRGKNPTDLTFLNFDKIETLGTSSEIPVLVLPAQKRVEFVLNARDVVHAFWVPDFLFKRDVMPYPEANNQVNRFQVTGLDEGAMVGRCAEMCGTYHSMMNFEVRVVSPENFKAYLAQREGGATNAQALQAIGEPPLAVTTAPFDTRRGEQAPEPTN